MSVTLTVSLLRHDVMQSGKSLLTFLRNPLSLSSG